MSIFCSDKCFSNPLVLIHTKILLGSIVDYNAIHPKSKELGLSGWIFVKGEKITGTISSLASNTYTPSTSNKTISAGQYLSGNQTILGDADLVAGNIKSGVNIFNVLGTYSEQISSGESFGTASKSYKVAVAIASGGDNTHSKCQASASISSGTNVLSYTSGNTNIGSGSDKACTKIAISVYKDVPSGASCSIGGSWAVAGGCWGFN